MYNQQFICLKNKVINTEMVTIWQQRADSWNSELGCALVKGERRQHKANEHKHRRAVENMGDGGVTLAKNSV